MTTDISSLQAQIDQLSSELYGKSPLIISPPVNPIDQLSAKQKEHLQQFQKTVLNELWPQIQQSSSSSSSSSADHKKQASHDDLVQQLNNPLTYYRYLKGYNWDEKLATEKIKYMMEFRMREHPIAFRMQQLQLIGRTQFIYLFGYDKCLRPTIYVNMKQIDKVPNWDSEENLLMLFRYVVYVTEVAIERMAQVHPHVFQANWIIDMNDASLGLSTVKKAKDVFLQLGDIHPERLFSAVICNTGWTLNILWNFIKYLLTEESIVKYKFVRKGNDAELKKIVSEMIDMQYMLEHVGGPVKNPYSVDKIIQLEKWKDELRQLQ